MVVLTRNLISRRISISRLISSVERAANRHVVARTQFGDRVFPKFDYEFDDAARVVELYARRVIDHYPPPERSSCSIIERDANRAGSSREITTRAQFR
jgi:hypothetical protein